MTSEVQAASHSIELEASKIENIFDLYYTYPINNKLIKILNFLFISIFNSTLFYLFIYKRLYSN